MVESSKSNSKSPIKLNTSVNPGNSVASPNNAAMADFIQEKIVGNGTFGVVYLASQLSTKEKVAIKRVFQDPRYKNRELELMQQLNHPNVVRLVQFFYTEGAKPGEIFLNLIMEFVPDTLHKVVRGMHKSGTVNGVVAKVYAYQILRSIGYCHLAGICHRDIKPQNLLVDPNTQRLVLCDFGSAKKLVHGEPNIAYICSRYYRAPELVLGATTYNTSIDIWSAGCVIAEIYLGRPLFPGDTAADQIVQIMRTLGTPTRDQVYEMNPKYNGAKLPDLKGITLSRVLRGKASPEVVNFLETLLNYSPSRRLNAYQALQHPFFDELRRPDVRLPNGLALPDLENWTDEEVKFMQRG